MLFENASGKHRKIWGVSEQLSKKSRTMVDIHWNLRRIKGVEIQKKINSKNLSTVFFTV
jgi:hypothetical protein